MAAKYSGDGARRDGITRRDFLHDVSLSAAALGIAPAVFGGDQSTTGSDGEAKERYYPPELTGMRGSHPGAFESAHALARDRKALSAAMPLGEHYDLVVVGAGISGLAAAYFYRQQHGDDARILLLDNHDDFGGHAKRNEFHQGGRMQLAWGGTVNIQYWNYSDAGNRLLRDLGVDIKRLLGNFEFDWDASGTGLSSGTWYDKQTYGRDVFVADFPYPDGGREELLELVPKLPISAEARETWRHFLQRDDKALTHLAADELDAYLHGTSYTTFLLQEGGLSQEAVDILDTIAMGSWGLRTPDLSVAECLESGLPGGHILDIDASEYAYDEGPSAMFPDGSASIARMLVRALLPDTFPQMRADDDPFDIVTADLDYGQLDREAAPVRLRLNSTVLHVENSEGEAGVELRYAQGGSLYSVSASQCVLACYNRFIPHICPSLPERQKQGLRESIKRPMGTLNVLLRNGKAIERSGIAAAYLPGSMLQMVSLVNGLNAGHYQVEWNPEESCLLHFFFGVAVEDPAGMDIAAQSQAGRLQLLAMEFEDFEQELRRVLQGIWGSHGLNLDEDILAITVNRWPHGYTRELNDLEDPTWLASPGPYEAGRQRFGNIAIANSDAGADAYTHTAIDQAWRAIGDLARPSAVDSSS